MEEDNILNPTKDSELINQIMRIKTENSNTNQSRDVDSTLIEEKEEKHEIINDIEQKEMEEKMTQIIEQTYFSEQDISNFADVSVLISHLDKWTPDNLDDWRKPVQLICLHFRKKCLPERDLFNLISQIESNGFGMWERTKSHQCYGRSKYYLFRNFRLIFCLCHFSIMSKSKFL